jgi:hypothetical protein
MLPIRRTLLPVATMVGGALIAALCTGCGGRGSPFVPHPQPISVSLSTSNVVVPQDGTPVHVQIMIRSTSETALVGFVGLPGGVEAKYAASDTNPSGLLTFMATKKVAAGTYMPIIAVNSAGQSATITFTMVVPAG